MNKLLKAAQRYRSLNISAIAADSNKRALQQWKRYTEQLPTEQELQDMFNYHRCECVAIICGEVSGRMEVIDVDCKYDITGTLFQDFMQAIMDADPQLAQRLVLGTTRGGGYHIFYRCQSIDGNKKLAQRLTTAQEKKDNPHEKVKVLIETRGESGYVIAVPTPGYKYIQHTIAEIPEITPEERAMLHNIARSFNSVIEEVHTGGAYVENKPYQKSPFQDYNERGDVVGLLERHGWTVVGRKGPKTIFLRPGDTKSKSSGDYNSELGLFSVFTTSSQFEPQKGYRPSTLFAMLECGGDWKAAAKRLLADGYGEPYKRISRDVRKSIIKLQEDGYDGERLQAKVASAHDISLSDAQQAISTVSAENGSEDSSFWTYDPEKGKVSIVYTRFKMFLQERGFGLYFYDPASTIFKIVHNDINLLEEASNERIKKIAQEFVENYNLEGVEYTKEQLLEVLYRNSNLFSENLYEYLPSLSIDFLRDTKDTCFIPFKNGIAEIKASGVRLLKHGDVNKVIWKSDLIDFNVDIDLNDDNGCEFLDFVAKVCGQDNDRLLNAISIIGYLLHKRKNPAKAYAIILGEETDDETKGGGTGKGIFIKALEKMLNVVTIDGKNFKAEKSFAYQRVSLDTKLVAIQDVEQNFDFKKFYSIITEGWTIEKKNKDELYINYQDSPKVILTTNYTINDDGNHAKRRQRLIEFSNYFSPDRTPMDEYGHLMFDDWDKDEWNRFYNFMFTCIKYYLTSGIRELPQGSRYKEKKIKTMFGEEFLNWFKGWVDDAPGHGQRISEVYNGFLAASELEKKDYSIKRFKKALRISAENFDYQLKEWHERQDNNLIHVKLMKSM